MKNLLGGIASPNPSFPQPISVVTGTQEVVVKNGNNETQATYTLHLGSLELAKIGTYQDYIYFDLDEGKWYKKGYIAKAILNTTNQTWLRNATNVTGKYRYITENFKSTIVKPSANNVLGNLLSNYYSLQVAGSNGSYGGNQGISVDTLGGLFINDNNYLDDLNGFKTWLDTINCIMYYAISTPTDEEITDTTLIADLDNILAMMSVEGITIIEVSGNLPGSLKVRAFAQLQAAT